MRRKSAPEVGEAAPVVFLFLRTERSICVLREGTLLPAVEVGNRRLMILEVNLWQNQEGHLALKSFGASGRGRTLLPSERLETEVGEFRLQPAP